MGKDVQPLQSVKTSILAELTVRSGLVDSCIDDDDSCVLYMFIIYYLMFYIIYVTLIMRLWELYNLVAILVEFDVDSLLLFPTPVRRSFGLVINQSVGSYRVELISEVGVVYPLFAIKGYLFYTKYVIYLCIVFWYYPLFVAICEIWLLRLTYGVYLVLSLKSGITKWYLSNVDCRTQA